MSSIAYLMQWGDHKNKVQKHLRVLFEEQKFVDVTLFCNTHSVRVHSVVIASNSSYFEKVLLSQNGMNSVIVFKDMKFEVLRALIEFMYCGETTVLDEDIDALLYASKKFEVKGLNKMTRHDVMFFAEKSENKSVTPNPEQGNPGCHFPAEPAQLGMIQTVVDVDDNQQPKSTELVNSNDNNGQINEVEALRFEKTLIRKRGRPKNRSSIFEETAVSDTEYAILKEAEESRRALEKLHRYVASAEASNNPIINSKPKSIPTSAPVNKKFKTQNSKDEHSHSNLIDMTEDEIAAHNLTNELNKDDCNRYLSSVGVPADLPVYVDDGNGNYVTLDAEMAKLIAGQQMKYNLMQGVVMTNDGKGLCETGNQPSNLSNILVPGSDENSIQQSNQYQDKNAETSRFKKPEANAEENNSVISELDDIICDFDSGKKVATTKKPFVVKEIIRVNQPKKKNGTTCRISNQKVEVEPIPINEKITSKELKNTDGEFLVAYDSNKIPYLINCNDNDNLAVSTDSSYTFVNDNNFEIIGVIECMADQKEKREEEQGGKSNETIDPELPLIQKIMRHRFEDCREVFDQ